MRASHGTAGIKPGGGGGAALPGTGTGGGGGADNFCQYGLFRQAGPAVRGRASSGASEAFADASSSGETSLRSHTRIGFAGPVSR